MCRASQQNELQAGIALAASQPADESRSAVMMEVEEQHSFGPGDTVSETQLQSEAIMEDVPDETELQESQQPAGQMQEHNGVSAPPPPPPQQQEAEPPAVSAPARKELQHAGLRAEEAVVDDEAVGNEAVVDEAVVDEEAALQEQRPAGMELDGASGGQQADSAAAAAGGSRGQQQLEQDADAALRPAAAGDANKYGSVWVTRANALGISAPQLQAALGL